MRLLSKIKFSIAWLRRSRVKNRKMITTKNIARLESSLNTFKCQGQGCSVYVETLMGDRFFLNMDKIEVVHDLEINFYSSIAIQPTDDYIISSVLLSPEGKFLRREEFQSIFSMQEFSTIKVKYNFWGRLQ